MSPEELDGIKAIARLLPESQTRNHIFLLLAHIDTQAAEVERLRSAPKSGLYGKYIIQKADGSLVDPHADYFVMRLDTDPIARRAALEYSYYLAAGKEDIKLAKDLQTRVARYDPKTEDAVYLRYAGVQKNEVVEQLEAAKAEVKRLRSQLGTWEQANSDLIAGLKAGATEVIAKDARIKELEAELENLNGMGTVGYMLGYKKGGDGNKVLIDYIKRLEAAFLDAKAERNFVLSNPLGSHPTERMEKARQGAIEALERIKADEKL